MESAARQMARNMSSEQLVAKLRARERLSTMETDEPGKYASFLTFLDTKRRSVLEKPIISDAPAVKQRLIEAFDKEEVRLEVFEEFLAAHGAR